MTARQVRPLLSLHSSRSGAVKTSPYRSGYSPASAAGTQKASSVGYVPTKEGELATGSVVELDEDELIFLRLNDVSGGDRLHRGQPVAVLVVSEGNRVPRAEPLEGLRV
jgi:hypothetical protein